ncbi:imidazole glycerol phosphate synthase subunit HisH [Thermostichus vulcanus]|uniref:Imidazole glycerol phosphate synthase subunit HisH n=1 Tax=Thermostichus vulcanus str. 'Rupite' TaxID=2813851 RepID=A0ABT0CCA0_THEVL|nr:imidazole glycerol phosphate synthase subunit HisH [Thermostichus vulcanus]MCJ2543388.1 imidazole glycerol phosphate synthase subunit HisH [Thermostichus vulcanus str. 'Rupite']
MGAVRLAVIDYDAGNLHSACKGLEHAGAEVHLIESPVGLEHFDGVVLPGDGAFDPAIQQLQERGFVDPIREGVRRQQPFLGICIGLQVLFDSSEEGNAAGLGIVPGQVRRFRPETGLRIPHMGWNQLQLTQPHAPLWSGIPVNTWAYFVHSYHVVPEDPTWVAATVQHGTQMAVAAIARGTLWATQFHPEKSGPYGLKMLQNFVGFVAQRDPSPSLASVQRA